MRRFSPAERSSCTGRTKTRAGYTRAFAVSITASKSRGFLSSPWASGTTARERAAAPVAAARTVHTFTADRQRGISALPRQGTERSPYTPIHRSQEGRGVSSGGDRTGRHRGGRRNAGRGTRSPSLDREDARPRRRAARRRGRRAVRRVDRPRDGDARPDGSRPGPRHGARDPDPRGDRALGRQPAPAPARGPRAGRPPGAGVLRRREDDRRRARGGRRVRALPRDASGLRGGVGAPRDGGGAAGGAPAGEAHLPRAAARVVPGGGGVGGGEGGRPRAEAFGPPRGRP